MQKIEYYGRTSIVLHWLGACALVASYWTGDALEGMRGAARADAQASHITWAALLAIPLLLRIGWRLHEGWRTTSMQSRGLQLLARGIMTGLLLAIAVAVITGFLLPWSRGGALRIGELALASPLAPSAELHGALEAIHAVASHLLLPLLALHLLGALKHAIIDRDGVLTAMLRRR